MEGLTAYDDYMQTLAFLRASRNRILNSVETTNLDHAKAAECTRLCNSLHDDHMTHGLRVLKQLHDAISARQGTAEIAKASSQLHRYNRQSARLARLFEGDLSTEHPDPEKYDDETKIPERLQPTALVNVDKFLGKLRNMVATAQQALART